MDVKEEEILGNSVFSHWYYVSKGRAITYFLQSIPFKSVLDIGAGSGVFSKMLLNTEKVESARCLDIAYANNNVEIYNGKPLHFVKSLDNISESVILMIDVLEHIEDDVGLLRSYVEQMPNGAHILISVPAFNFLWSGHDIFLEHKRRYTLAKLERLVADAGLSVVCSRYFFGVLFPVVAIIRIINKVRLRAGALMPKSDLRMPSYLLNKLLIGINLIELRTLLHINTLGGLTIFCLAQKQSAK
ncbi:methyltransferase domain-containing protein [Methylomonas sp. MgM2]